MNRLRRIGALVRKELRQLRRDHLTLALIVGIPTLQLILFGYAINLDVRHLPAGFADASQSVASRALISDLSHSQVLHMQYRVASVRELEALLREGSIRVGIWVPEDYQRRLQQPQRAAVQLLVDGSDTVVGNAVRQLAGGVRLSPYHDRPPAMEVRTYFNPERRSAVNTVPGLVGVILTMTMVLFTAMAIVRERERGNMEMLIATPVGVGELMLAKIIPYVGIGLLQVTLVLMLGQTLFDVPVRGAWLDVYLVALAFIVANLTLGLVISTLAKTQFQAMQMTLFVLLPSILMSGFMFPFEGMPELAQWLAEVLPLTHFVRLIRGIMLRGAGLVEMGEELIVLAVFSVLALSVAMLRFSKRLD